MQLLLTLLAMGNWGNTPSPPIDAEAPDPVGNEGELSLEMAGQSYRGLIQSARLSSEGLLVEGETVGGRPSFRLCAALPEDALEPEPTALKGKTCTISAASFPEIEADLAGGMLRVMSVTGSGPWEIDAEFELASASGDSGHGTMQARLRV